MSQDQIILALSEFHSERWPFLYALMNGYAHKLRDAEHAEDFIKAIYAEPDFWRDDVTRALDRFFDAVEEICTVEDATYYRRYSKLDPATLDAIEAFRLEARKFGAATLIERVGFDVRYWMVHQAIDRRAADLKAIADMLEDRKLYLRPLLMRARSPNKYGETDYEAYYAELREFGEYYFPKGTLKFFDLGFPSTLCHNMVTPWFAEAIEPVEMPTNGVDFEHWCAAQIEQQGWAVRVSKASGDQGIDLEAMRPGFTVAVQCKRYTTPIGNKAVQEAFAGVTHYKADVACVIGTGGFTPAAQQLALSTGVILIDASSIADFSSLVERDG